MPELGKRRLVAELGGGNLGARPGQQLALPVDVRHECAEGVREALGRAAIGDHCPGHEPRNVIVRHAVQHGPDNVDLPDHGIGALAASDQAQHASGRQPACGVAKSGEQLVQVATLGLDHPAQQVEEHVRAIVGSSGGGDPIDLRHEQVELDGVTQGLAYQGRQRFVQIHLRSGHGRGENVLDCLRPPLLFPQRFGVIDLLDLEAGFPGARPQTADAAVRAEVLRGTRKQEQEAAPGVGTGARVDRERANQVPVEESADLDDGPVGVRRPGAVDQQATCERLDAKGMTGGETVRNGGQAGQRRLDRGMAGRVQRHGARRRAARAREPSQVGSGPFSEDGRRAPGRRVESGPRRFRHGSTADAVGVIVIYSSVRVYRDMTLLSTHPACASSI